MNGYKFTDLWQAFVGSMTGILGLILFFVFGDQKSGVVISPTFGFIFTLIFLALLYFSTKKMLKKNVLEHLSIDYGISLVLSIIFAYLFHMIDNQIMLSFDFFGSIPIIVSWMIVIPAVVFDIKDLGGFIERYTYFGGVTENGNGKVAISYYCNTKYKNPTDVEKCIKGEI